MKTATKVEVIDIDGHIYPVLRRKKERFPTEPCLFCQQPHRHGIPDGHRVVRCGTIFQLGKAYNPAELVQLQDEEGRVITLRQEDGYVVLTGPRPEMKNTWTLVVRELKARL
jgi:hypothetical protein